MAHRVHPRKFIFFLLAGILFLQVYPDASGQDGFRLRRRAEPADVPADTLVTSFQPQGLPLEILFERGKEHNHPLMAIWIEDLDSNYIQTLYVAKSIAKGVFRHGDPSTGRWKPGPIRRPAALPYWGHQRGVQAGDGYFIPDQDDPMPDALTGATPKNNFVLQSHTPADVNHKFRLLFEINQSWNWNEYWTNNKFPDDEHYMTSSQPAIVYEAFIDLEDGKYEYEMKAIGHSHWSGKDGRLFTDLSTITTALEIAESIKVRFPE